MSTSMPEEEQTTHSRAFSYAVVDQNMTFAAADAFADSLRGSVAHLPG